MNCIFLLISLIWLNCTEGFVPPQNWTYLNSSSRYFKIFETNVSFWKANNNCKQSHNSDLIQIDSEQSWIEISRILIIKNISEVWIGLTDFGSEGNFYWISNNSKNSLKYWAKGYPKDFRNASDCVLATRDEDKYSWRDVHCAQAHYYICMWINKTDAPAGKSLPDQSHYTDQCPKPYFQIDGDCFLVSNETLSWNDSRTVCQRKHEESDLASIRTEYQIEYFAALLSGKSPGFWIGMNFYEGKYQWILQHDLSSSNHVENEQQDNQSNCIYMNSNEHKLGRLTKESCSAKLKMICQTLKKNNSTQISNSNTSDSDINYDGVLFQKNECLKSGYVYYHGSCYRLLSEKSVSHDKAVELCKQETFQNENNFTFSVKLVNFETLGEKYFILSNFRRVINDSPNALWLGLNGLKSENETLLHIEILNNTQVSNLQYIPNSMKKVKNICFKLLLSGIVNTTSCEDGSGAITMCKYQLKNFNVEVLNSNKQNASCPKNWKLFNSVCFYYESRVYISMYRAKTKCLKLGSHVPSIDMHQQSFLINFLKTMHSKGSKQTRFWIGLEIIKKSNLSIQYKWMNEEPLLYLNMKMSQFIYNHPNDKNWCTQFSAENGLWEIVNCTGVEAGLLCQKDANITSITPPKLITPTKVTTIPIMKSQYLIFDTPLMWNESLKQCLSLSSSGSGFTSNLADFKEFSDTFEIQSLVYGNKSISTSTFWIGLSGFYDHFDNAFIHWSDNSSLKFQNFDYNNLMNLTRNENCVLLDAHSGKWLITACDEKHSFICKKKRKSYDKETESPSSELMDLKQLNNCPEHYIQYSNRCYRVIEDKKMGWDDADSFCRKLVPKKYHISATLATIESTFDNSFVYSLLSANMYSKNDTRYWIGTKYKSKNSIRNICVGISGHPDPYVGARWFSQNCSTPLKFVCSVIISMGNENPDKSKKCRSDYEQYDSSMGTSCYSLKPHGGNLKEAENRCNLEKINAHLLTLKSHYHMHFLRSLVSHEGLSRDRSIWLGAEIESHQKYYNWQWVDGEDIRYTVWNKAPVFDGDLLGNYCFYFIVEKDLNNRFGMQIEECSKLIDKKYVICEYSIKNDNVKDLDRKDNLNCLNDVKGNAYVGQVNTSFSGQRCIRWDLLNSSKMLSKIVHSIRKDPQKHKYIQFQSNECRHIRGMDQQTTFCAVKKDWSDEEYSFEECEVQLCRNISKTLHHEMDITEIHSKTLTIVLVTMVLFLCMIICIAMLSWRRWNKGALFGGYLRRSQFSFLNNQSRGTSFNNPIYRPINT